MEEHSKHIREQTFGDYLREEREHAGLTLRDLAKVSGLAPSTLSRWENNRVVPARPDVVKADQSLKASGRLVANWELSTSVGFPPWMRNVNRLEEAASIIELVSPHLVPGLLQSPQYARCVFQEGQHQGTAKDIDHMVARRCARYEQLQAQNDPRITAVFPVASLVCAPAPVRQEQAKHLLSLGDSDRVMVHLVPEGTVLMGIVSMLLMFHLKDGGQAAVSDHVAGAYIYEDKRVYPSLHALVKQALGCALPAKQSREALEKLL